MIQLTNLTNQESLEGIVYGTLLIAREKLYHAENRTGDPTVNGKYANHYTTTSYSQKSESLEFVCMPSANIMVYPITISF